MGNHEQLKKAVADVIKSNGNQEITGAILQNTLLTIISTVGDGATFAGIATPSTNPGTPDQNVFYIAASNGVYSNFNAIELNNEVAILVIENNTWVKKETYIADILSNTIIVNRIFYNVGGALVKFNGRFQVNRLFPIEAEPTVSFTPSLVVYKRYYDIDGKYIGTSYSSNANFICVGGVVNDKNIPITYNEAAKYVLSFNGVKYQCVNGLPLVNDEVENINETITDIKRNFYVQPNKFFINKPDGDISIKFSNIEDEYCDITVNAVNGAILLHVQSDRFIPDLRNVSFSHVPYKYGMLYAKLDVTNHKLSSYEVGRLGFYATDVDILRPQKGYYYIPIIAWNDGKIVYRIENYSEYDELRTKALNAVAKDEMLNFNLVGCFERIVCLGDSITAGYTGSAFAGQNVGSNDARVTARNWPAYFAKSIGSDVVNLGYGSSKTTDWRNSTPETEAQNLYCAMDLANIEGTQAYFNMIGWNDTIAVGTSADIQTDYNDNAMSFYGNYDYIVRKLHDYKPKAHIFVFTLARSRKTSPYNGAIRYIAALYPDYCHCIDYSNNPFFDTAFFNAVADDTHFSPLGYNAFAQLVKSLVNQYIYDNPSKFKGIPYTADEAKKGSIDVQGLVLSSANVELQEIGTYTTLVANILPNTAANKNVSWSVISGDSSCITLIPNQSTIYCTIKGNSQGFAVVQASSQEGGNKATCLVAVAQKIVNVTNITLSKTRLDIPLSGGEKSITATITPGNATNKNVRWTLQSGGDKVATIEGTGLTCIITPRGIGNDVIIATTEDCNKVATCNINVTN